MVILRIIWAHDRKGSETSIEALKGISIGFAKCCDMGDLLVQRIDGIKDGECWICRLWKESWDWSE